MKKQAYVMTVVAMVSGGVATEARGQNTSSDVQVVLNVDHGVSWWVSSFSPPGANVVPGTGSGNPNPVMSLEIGKRFHFNNLGAGHPYSLFADGATDDFLLSEYGDPGTFEANPAVDWYDDGVDDMYFTVTPALADALTAPGKVARYTCLTHFGIMQGDLAFKAAATNLIWPGGSEPFENALVGTSVDAAFTSWVIAVGGPTYTAVISQSPVGHPGQAVGSTRWLTVTDADAASASRVYSPGIILSSGTVGRYTFSSHVDIQSIAAGSTFLIVGQNASSPTPFSNVGGLEITDSGVNVIILGAADGGIGKAGATVRTLLVNFTDPGGFGLNNWVQLGFTIDFDAGEVRGTATGSNGTTTVNQTLAGLVLQVPSPNEFRWCIRNNAAGSTSVVSYDNVVFSGVASPSLTRDWEGFK